MAIAPARLPSERRVQVSNLLNCVVMYQGDLLDIDDLAMQACALLDQYRSRGISDSLQRNLVNRALDQNHRDRIIELLAAFKAVIKEHDEKVQADDANLAAAQVALLAHASAASRHVSLAQAPMHDASFPASPTQSSFSTPSSSATDHNTNRTEGNTNANSQLGAVDMTGRCTIRLSRPRRKEQRQHQEANAVSLVAAARATHPRLGPRADTGRGPGRPQTEHGRCMQTEFRKFAFQAGRTYLQEGTLENVTMAEVVKAFADQNPGAPSSLKCSITKGDWINAVRSDDVTRLVLGRGVSLVKTVDTIEEKLEIRPDLKYLIDWCVGWLRSERAAHAPPPARENDRERFDYILL